MSGDEEYCYPPSFTVLKNKLNIRDAQALDRFERRFVVQRIAQGVPTGDFDLAHLRAIHRHIFQDVYEWAGEIRTVEISKGGSRFQPRRFIEIGMADIHRRLVEHGFLKGLGAAIFAREAGNIIGDINHAHPFREGNGRVQMVYLQLLALQAGHVIDLRRIERDRWMRASRESHLGSCASMSGCIADAIVESRIR